MRIIGGGQLSKSGTPLHSGQGPAIVSNTFLVKKPNGDNQHILNIDGTTTLRSYCFERTAFPKSTQAAQLTITSGLTSYIIFNN